jgi:hypothetical protein
MEFRPVTVKAATGWLWALVIFILVATLLPLGLLTRVIWGGTHMTYELTASDVVIHFGSAAYEVPRASISGTEVLRQTTQRRRLNGTAVKGLYQGSWSFAETGRITLYATGLGQVVVLHTADKTWGITPVKPEQFIADLQNGATGTYRPVEGGASPWAPASFLLFLVPVVAMAIGIVIYYVRIPKSICYYLADEGLLITGGWRRLMVPYSAITGAVEASPARGPWRKVGAAFPGLYWGSFSWRQAGPNLWLYATRYKPLVLVSTASATYGITPEESERFVAELTRRLPA